MTHQEISEKASRMQSYLEEKTPNEDEKVITRLENLQVLLAQSGELLAQAKYNLDTKKNSAISEALKEAMEKDWTTTIITKKIDALCRDENYIYLKVDRINSTAVHQIDAIRSILSFRKAQLQLT